MIGWIFCGIACALWCWAIFTRTDRTWIWDAILCALFCWAMCDRAELIVERAAANARIAEGMPK